MRLPGIGLDMRVSRMSVAPSPHFHLHFPTDPMTFGQPPSNAVSAPGGPLYRMPSSHMRQMHGLSTLTP